MSVVALSESVAISNRCGITTPWLLLVFSLPRKGASLRVSVWRKLQRYGSLPLGNSGYLLPNNLSNREKFARLATTIRGSRGEASVVEVQSIDNYSSPQLAKRFSDARTQDYRELLMAIRNAPAKKRAIQDARLRQRFQEIVSLDFFGSPLRWPSGKNLGRHAAATIETDSPGTREGFPVCMRTGLPGTISS